MPELPEVETVRKDLIRAGLPGRVIQSADLFWHRTLAVPSLKDFEMKIAGAKIKGLARRGKYLIFNLDKGCLVMHLRMSGRIDFKSKAFDPRKHDRARLVFTDGAQLLFHDTRKFGRWYFTDDATKIVGKLGIEPLDKKFTAGWLAEKLKNKKRTLKPLLLDQSLVAGIGNIYADEALFEAKIHPRVMTHTLTFKQVRALNTAIKKVLRQAIRFRGSTLRDFVDADGVVGSYRSRHKVYDRAGENCPRCKKHKIERIVLGGRSTCFCAVCQPDK